MAYGETRPEFGVGDEADLIDQRRKAAKAMLEKEPSNMFSSLGGLAGAGVGFVTGGPAGAVAGYKTGKAVGGFIDDPSVGGAVDAGEAYLTGEEKKKKKKALEPDEELGPATDTGTYF